MMLRESIVATLSVFPPELATLILAMIPVGELRGALPVAVLGYKLPLIQAYILSVLGNMIPVYFLLVFLERVSNWIRANWDFGRRILEWFFERTRHKLHGNVEKYGVWALALFVAVPLPVTGAWTGSAAAFVFGLPKKQAFWTIFAGVCISGVIVSFITVGGGAVFRLLQ